MKRIPQMSGEENAPWPPQVAAPSSEHDAVGWSVSLASPANTSNMYTQYGPYVPRAGAHHHQHYEEPLAEYQQGSCYSDDYASTAPEPTDYSQQQPGWPFTQQQMITAGLQHQQRQLQQHQYQLEPLYKSLSMQMNNSSGEHDVNINNIA